MADKDLKRLGRLELVEIIYTLQVQNEEKDAEISKLKLQLEAKESAAPDSEKVLETAGKLSSVFEEATALTDRYLESVDALNGELEEKRAFEEKRNKLLLEGAKQKAFEIISTAQTEAQKIIDDAERKAAEKFEAFQKKALKLAKLQKELGAILEGKDS